MPAHALHVQLDADARGVGNDAAQTGIGVLSYIFDHERRDLARRLTHTHHDHHVMNLSTLHLHLDHHNCLEVAVLRGPVGEMRALADQVTAERGVAFGDLRLVADPAKGRASGS